MDFVKTKNEILESFIENIIYYGVNLHCLEKSCEQLSYDPALAKILFQDFRKEACEYLFINAMDYAVGKIDSNFLSLKVRERIENLVVDFLSFLLPKRNQLNILLKTYNIEVLLNNFIITYNVSSHFWYESGDQSTDFNHYSKRILLSYVAISSFFHMLQGSNAEEIRKFVRDKIEQVLKLGKLKFCGKSIVQKIPFLRLMKL